MNITKQVLIITYFLTVPTSLISSIESAPKAPPRRHPPQTRIKKDKKSKETVDNQKIKELLKKYGGTHGNKTANLKVLKKTCQSFYKTNVPPFFGIKHNDIVDFLKIENESEAIINLWHSFQAIIAKHPGLPQSAKDMLQKIRSKILGVNFAKMYESLVNEEKVSKKRHDKYQQFIEKSEKKNYLLMVRSTGREDSLELSNSGGNASISSVTPDTKSISKAIGEVLSSYFSEKSILQRIIGKDKTLTKGDPFMAVLLQRMVGEGSGKNPDVIPKSGVIYSTEGEGNSPGITIIQSTWGHNEAVVNGLAPVDSYYINNNFSIFPVIRRKQRRLKTINHALESVSNDEELIEQTTLSKQQVLKLKRIANHLEEIYNYPVDIEFVFHNDQLYLVQARPIEEKKLNPSFISPEFFNESTTLTNLLPATMIGVGNAQTSFIQNKNEIIIANNIRQALQQYLDLIAIDPEAKNSLKGVIINEMAPSTSHEANQFRGQLKPVFYLESLDAIEDALQNHIPFYADPQRSSILITDNDDLRAIKKGWFSHPIPPITSLISEFIANKKLPSFDRIKKENFQHLAFFIQKIKEAKPEEAIEATERLQKQLLQAIHGEISKAKKKESELTETNKKLIQTLFMLAVKIHEATEEQINILKKEDHSEIQRLYPLTFIIALIKQLPHSQLVNNISFGSLVKTEKIELESVADLKLKNNQLRDYIVQYDKASNYLMTESMKNKWKEFITKLNIDENKKISQLLHSISKLEMLPLWINTSFTKAVNGSDRKKSNQAQILLEEFQQEEEFLGNLNHIKQELESINIEAFSDPTLFDKHFSKMRCFEQSSFRYC